MPTFSKTCVAALLVAAPALQALADENLFGYVRGAEPLPVHALAFYALASSREGKGVGGYSAWDVGAEVEYGVTDKTAVAGRLFALGIESSAQDPRAPRDARHSWRFSGVEGSLKYNFLSPARDDIGVSTYTTVSYRGVAPSSGSDEEAFALAQWLLLQKYFLEGQLILAGNLGLEATRIEDPAGSTQDSATEIELKSAAGVTYRFVSNWFVGAEAFYAQDEQSERNVERWFVRGGPSVHYGSAKWWATLTWVSQLMDGGDTDRAVDAGWVETADDEYRFKFGINF